MLPKPLSELIAIARRDDWHRHLVGSDLRQILNEVERLSGQVRERLVRTIAGWKKHLGRLDMITAEIARTPGAEAIAPLAKKASDAIDALERRMHDCACRASEQWVVTEKVCPRPPLIYVVPVHPGEDKTEKLGVVQEAVLGGWDWWRRESTYHRWNDNANGNADTREEAMNHVLEGWGWDLT